MERVRTCSVLCLVQIEYRREGKKHNTHQRVENNSSENTARFELSLDANTVEADNAVVSESVDTSCDPTLGDSVVGIER